MKFRREVITSILSVILTVATLIMVITISYGWFAENKEVEAMGMSVQVAKDETVKIHSEVKVHYIYLSGGKYVEVNDTYTRRDDGLLVNDEGNGINFSGLIPGEYVDLTVSFTCSTENDGSTYKLYFGNFDFGISYDDENYESAANSESGWFKDGDYYHNVLGVYRYEVIGLKYMDESITDTLTVSNHTDWTWFNTYDDSKNDEEVSEAILYTDTWNQGDNYVSLTFRVQLSLDQFNTKLKGTTHELSERTFSIGTLFIGAE